MKKSNLGHLKSQMKFAATGHDVGARLAAPGREKGPHHKHTGSRKG